MHGIDMNKQMQYTHASFRFFEEGESHVTRYCEDDVLLLVYDGILRFTEDGQDIEVCPGEYFIQHHGGFQEGRFQSTSPKYLYIHFYGEWCDDITALPKRGLFDYSVLERDISEMHRLSHGKATYIECAAQFYKILSLLMPRNAVDTTAERIAEYIARHFREEITLEGISHKFSFSKNHIINIFKSEYGITPFRYISDVRIKNAEQLLEMTSENTETISVECGFASYSHFYKQFLRANGISPSEWRIRRRKGSW